MLLSSFPHPARNLPACPGEKEATRVSGRAVIESVISLAVTFGIGRRVEGGKMEAKAPLCQTLGISSKGLQLQRAEQSLLGVGHHGWWKNC